MDPEQQPPQSTQTPPENAPQNPTLPKKPFSKKKIVIIVLGILFFLFLGLPISGYILFQTKDPLSKWIGNESNIKTTPSVTNTISPTPDPTADWKTYRNDKYGFEFKYPVEYIEEPQEKPYIASIDETPLRISVKSKSQEKAGFTLTMIDVYMNESSFHDFDNLNDCDIDKHPGTELGIVPCAFEKPQMTKVGDKNARKLNIWVADTFARPYIQTTEKPFLEISAGPFHSAVDLDQIRSTFKFTE